MSRYLTTNSETQVGVLEETSNLPKSFGERARMVLLLLLLQLVMLLASLQGTEGDKIILPNLDLPPEAKEFGQSGKVDIQSKSVDILVRISNSPILSFLKDGKKNLLLTSQGSKVHYLEAKAGSILPEANNKTLFLLHGAAFTSNTWTRHDLDLACPWITRSHFIFRRSKASRQVDTIPTMAAAGFHVIAVDLPGEDLSIFW